MEALAQCGRGAGALGARHCMQIVGLVEAGKLVERRARASMSPPGSHPGSSQSRSTVPMRWIASG
jgi:hypothetical protein